MLISCNISTLVCSRYNAGPPFISTGKNCMNTVESRLLTYSIWLTSCDCTAFLGTCSKVDQNMKLNQLSSKTIPTSELPIPSVACGFFSGGVIEAYCTYICTVHWNQRPSQKWEWGAELCPEMSIHQQVIEGKVAIVQLQNEIRETNVFSKPAPPTPQNMQ